MMLARSPRRRALLASLVAPNKKWTAEALELLRVEWAAGTPRDEIARKIDALLGTAGMTGHAVMVRANKEGWTRDAAARGRLHQAGALRYSHGPNKEKWAAALGRRGAGGNGGRGEKRHVPRDVAEAAWGDPELTTRGVEAATGLTYQTLWNWFGPRPVARAAWLAKRGGAVAVVRVAEPGPAPRPVVVKPPVAAKAAPASAGARQPAGRPFSMLAMAGPDPYRALREQQSATASRGRI